jgi:hypothetical protein
MRFFLLCILALICTGCPQRLVTRQVTLAGLTGDAQTSASVSVTSPEVQTALKIIDRVLVSYGFAPTEDPNLTVPDSLVTYAKLTPEGLTMGGPSVSLKGGRLVVVVAGRGGLSAESKSILKAVKVELKNNYGADRVKTGR